jgi:glucose/arabinose dehydrogenase
MFLGRDLLGDATPDELNHAPVAGLHFGFPYCLGQNIPDPEVSVPWNCSQATPPALDLAPHAAAVGMLFYTGKMFPAEYRNQLFIAEHGSWNRPTGSRTGYRISLVHFDATGATTSYQTFAEFTEPGTITGGRPVDVKMLSDGSLLGTVV